MNPPIEHRQGLPKGRRGKFRQTGFQIRPCYPGQIAGFHIARALRRLFFQEISRQLGRGTIGFTPRPEGRLFPFPLKAHPGQGIVPPEILRFHAYQHRRVGVFPGPGVEAHAVGHHAARFGSRRHHLAPRAHAEGINPPAAGGAAIELIIRRAQSRMPGKFAILGPVDGGLIVLHPHADGKGLADHGHTHLMKHFEGIPGAMAHGQQHVPGLHPAQALRGLHLRADDRAFFRNQLCQPRLEPHLAAQGADFFPNVFHHAPEPVGADMGLGRVEDFLRCASLVQGLKHLRAAGILNARGELAVGKRPRAALAELHVADGVQLSRGPEDIHVPAAPVHAASPFDHQRRKAHFRQRQRCEKPRRAQAHHQRPGRQ